MVTSINKLEGSPMNIVYRASFYKYEPITDKKIYIVELTCYDVVKISNFSYVMKAQNEAIISLTSKDNSINKENSVFISFFNALKGIRFIPDLNILKYSVSTKNNLESKFNITLGGVVLILPSWASNRYKKALLHVISFSNMNVNFQIVTSIDDAYKSIAKFGI
jgi:hypothetical protein